jgi:hypothetical protein
MTRRCLAALAGLFGWLSVGVPAADPYLSEVVSQNDSGLRDDQVLWPVKEIPFSTAPQRHYPLQVCAFARCPRKRF